MAVSIAPGQSPSLIAVHHPVGASTGYMQSLRGNWDAQVAEAIEVSPYAVELSALSEAELEPLERYFAKRPALPFRYVSIHGPSKARRLGEAELVARLARLAPRCDALVMHPDTIDDPACYEALGRVLVLENMDGRKATGRSVEELEPLFDRLPQAGFCFDIAHASSIDPGMGLASELLDAFGDRLRHVHLSSLTADSRHVPLRVEDEERFRDALRRCLDVPWILEAPPRAS